MEPALQKLHHHAALQTMLFSHSCVKTWTKHKQHGRLLKANIRTWTETLKQHVTKTENTTKQMRTEWEETEVTVCDWTVESAWRKWDLHAEELNEAIVNTKQKTPGYSGRRTSTMHCGGLDERQIQWWITKLVMMLELWFGAGPVPFIKTTAWREHFLRHWWYGAACQLKALFSKCTSLPSYLEHGPYPSTWKNVWGW